MNEKKYKIAIICLAVVCLILGGFTVYFGRSGSVEYANKLRNTITELRAKHIEQGKDLEYVTGELGAANVIVGELRADRLRAYELVLRNDERITGLESTMADITAIGGSGLERIDRIISRLPGIEEYTRSLRAENNELRNALGERNEGR